MNILVWLLEHAWSVFILVSCMLGGLKVLIDRQC